MIRLFDPPGEAFRRKYRLVAAACCRRLERLFLHPAQAAGLDVLERFADGLATADGLRAAEEATGRFDELHPLYSEERDDIGSYALDAAFHAAQAIAQATCNDPPPAAEDDPTYADRIEDVLMHTADAAGFVAADREFGTEYPGPEAVWLARAPATAAEQQVLADLVRCVFGNPFRPVAAEPGWRTSAVVDLATGIYADRAWDRLPVLADALEDAGCANADVLAHLRGPGPHAAAGSSTFCSGRRSWFPSPGLRPLRGRRPPSPLRGEGKNRAAASATGWPGAAASRAAPPAGVLRRLCLRPLPLGEL